MKSLFKFCLLALTLNINAQSSELKLKQSFLKGCWMNLKDSASLVFIDSKNWIWLYKNTSEEKNQYKLFTKDSLVITDKKDKSKLVYRVVSLSDSYMDLSYIQMDGNKPTGYTVMQSYTKISHEKKHCRSK